MNGMYIGLICSLCLELVSYVTMQEGEHCNDCSCLISAT